jgi:hypothetical protein
MADTQISSNLAEMAAAAKEASNKAGNALNSFVNSEGDKGDKTSGPTLTPLGNTAPNSPKADVAVEENPKSPSNDSESWKATPKEIFIKSEKLFQNIKSMSSSANPSRKAARDNIMTALQISAMKQCDFLFKEMDTVLSAQTFEHVEELKSQIDMSQLSLRIAEKQIYERDEQLSERDESLEKEKAKHIKEIAHLKAETAYLSKETAYLKSLLEDEKKESQNLREKLKQQESRMASVFDDCMRLTKTKRSLSPDLPLSSKKA